MKNVSSVLSANVCTGCGCCSAICPQHCLSTSIDIEKGYYTTLLADGCTDCGLCQKVCPIYTWDNQKGNPYVGNYLSVFSGYSTDNEHRKNSASGGMTTAILAYMLKEQIIEAAVVAFRKKEDPLKAEMRIVTSYEDIYNSKGSVYAPTTYYSIIEEIAKSPYSKLAIVGLPCHIEGMSNLMTLHRQIKNKTILKIALVCGHTPSIKGYEYSLKRLGIKKDEVTSIANRGDGWPGYLKITSKTSDLRIEYGNKYSWGMILSSPIYTPAGCLHCVDATGYQADISICDAWLKKFREDKIGRNLLLVRSVEMISIIEKMKKENLICISEETIADFIKANEQVFKEKLIVNGIRNKKSLKHKGNKIYSRMAFLNSDSLLGNFFIRWALINENIYLHFKRCIPINNQILFIFKLFKFLSLKWITLKRF